MKACVMDCGFHQVPSRRGNRRSCSFQPAPTCRRIVVLGLDMRAQHRDRAVVEVDRAGGALGLLLVGGRVAVLAGGDGLAYGRRGGVEVKVGAALAEELRAAHAGMRGEEPHGAEVMTLAGFEELPQLGCGPGMHAAPPCRLDEAERWRIRKACGVASDEPPMERRLLTGFRIYAHVESRKAGPGRQLHVVHRTAWGYGCPMEMEYGDEATRRLHLKGLSYGKGFDKQAIMRLNRIKAAVDQRDLSALKGNRFEKLKGDRAGTNSIRINDQWRITFRIEKNRALDVTIEDYH
jgi:toxin HigB-1